MRVRVIALPRTVQKKKPLFFSMSEMLGSHRRKAQAERKWEEGSNCHWVLNSKTSGQAHPCPSSWSARSLTPLPPS